MPDNYDRREKILAALGLASPPNVATHVEDKIYEDFTGYTPYDLKQGLNRWEDANPLMVGFAKMLAKRQLTPDNVQGRVDRIKQNLQQGRYDQDFSGRNDGRAVATNFINRMQNPKLLDLAMNLVKNLNRPSDMDKIPVESVVSSISFPK